MEVQLVNGEEMLVYLAWATPDGLPPRSISERTCYRKGQGVAGIAWQRARAVVEDAFRHGIEWVDNYPQQGERYSSMTWVPVVVSSQEGSQNVIGVITVDTNISGFFGEKDNRSDEAMAGTKILPYATYIAFISTFDRLADVVQPILAVAAKEESR